MSRALLLASCLLAACSLDSEPSDGSSPQISIDSPLNNAIVSGQVAISLTVTDDFGVDEVRILIDGAERAKQFTPPFGYIWNTVLLAENSTHEIKVEAKDLSGNFSSKSVHVTVDNGPLIRQ